MAVPRLCPPSPAGLMPAAWPSGSSHQVGPREPSFPPPSTPRPPSPPPGPSPSRPFPSDQQFPTALPQSLPRWAATGSPAAPHPLATPLSRLRPGPRPTAQAVTMALANSGSAQVHSGLGSGPAGSGLAGRPGLSPGLPAAQGMWVPEAAPAAPAARKALRRLPRLPELGPWRSRAGGEEEGTRRDVSSPADRAATAWEWEARARRAGGGRGRCRRLRCGWRGGQGTRSLREAQKPGVHSRAGRQAAPRRGGPSRGSEGQQGRCRARGSDGGGRSGKAGTGRGRWGAALGAGSGGHGAGRREGGEQRGRVSHADRQRPARTGRSLTELKGHRRPR